MLTQEQIARLTKLGSEQLVIAEKWDKEKDERDKLIDVLGEADKSGNKELFMATLDKMVHSTPDMCEHERSIWSNCAGCEEIEMALHPEMYDEEGCRIDEE